jgi:hypothetical protein
MIYTKGDLIDILRPIVEANDEIQDYVSERGTNKSDNPGELINLIFHLDTAIRNAGLKAT